jgi:hypothetical protein
LREARVLPALMLTLWLTGPPPQQPRLSDEQIDQVIAYARTGDDFGGLRGYSGGRAGDRSEFSGGFAASHWRTAADHRRAQNHRESARRDGDGW